MRFPLTIAAVMVASTALAGAVMAQAAGGLQTPGGRSLSSTNANGAQIQGNTTINASAENMNTTAVGQGNKANSTVGGIGK